MDDLFKVYFNPAEIGDDDYPYAWHGKRPPVIRILELGIGPTLLEQPLPHPAIKDLVREEAGHRCVRCAHPFIVGSTPGRWSPCDERCSHGGPVRRSCAGYLDLELKAGETAGMIAAAATQEKVPVVIEAEWRVLTVHHLNGVKYDCRWWNLVALCQRCHLTIQAKVHMARRWNRKHSEWFWPYVGGYYASTILGEELSREEVMDRIHELLELEHTQKSLLDRDEFDPPRVAKRRTT